MPEGAYLPQSSEGQAALLLSNHPDSAANRCCLDSGSRADYPNLKKARQKALQPLINAMVGLRMTPCVEPIGHEIYIESLNNF